jgi:hypothetical protein
MGDWRNRSCVRKPVSHRHLIAELAGAKTKVNREMNAGWAFLWRRSDIAETFLASDPCPHSHHNSNRTSAGLKALPLRNAFRPEAHSDEPDQADRTVCWEVNMPASVAQTAHRTAPSLPRSVREPKTVSLSRMDRDHLGERLLAMYEALRDESLPERLQDVVNRLAQSQSE